MRRRVFRPDDVDLRQRTERALAGDAYLVATLHHARHFAFDGESRREGVFELALRRCVANALAGEHDAAAGGHDHPRNAIANRYLNVSVRILQLGDVDLRLAFAAHVDESHFRAEAHDGALDGLSPPELARLYGRVEHCREIFFLVAHCTLLYVCTPGAPGAERLPSCLLMRAKAIMDGLSLTHAR